MADVTKLGIENLKKGIKFMLDLAKQIETSGKDGWKWSDCFAFIPELLLIPGIAKSGKDMLAELNDLDPSERADLDAFVQAEFNISSLKVESVVESAFDTALSIVNLIEKIKA